MWRPKKRKPFSSIPSEGSHRVWIFRLRVCPIGTQIKYLSLVLDSTWCFVEHFTQLAPRINKDRRRSVFADSSPILGDRGRAPSICEGRSLDRPICGSSLGCRSSGLPANTGNNLQAVPPGGHKGDQKVPDDLLGATVLARFLPLELQAQMYAQVYYRVRELREANPRPYE